MRFSISFAYEEFETGAEVDVPVLLPDDEEVLPDDEEVLPDGVPSDGFTDDGYFILLPPERMLVITDCNLQRRVVQV